IISRTGEQAAAVAEKYGAKHSSTELEDALARERRAADYGDGRKATVPLNCRILTLDEIEYFKNGGILQ
ncbi:MAG TPA: hypothetical protein PKH97_16390, partial [Tetrasphaera sp.]|uniref:hypothetical protein n=1 Tax=Nostocoides sp. TaxID=1917966 RepID=UPI002B7BD7C0